MRITSLSRSFTALGCLVVLCVTVVHSQERLTITPLAPVAYQYPDWKAGISMAPLEPLAEMVGMQLRYEGGRTRISSAGRTASFLLGGDSLLIGDRYIDFPCAPFREAAATYVPVRTIIEAFGGTLTATKSGTISILLASLNSHTATMLLRTRDGFPGNAYCGATELFVINTDGTGLRRLTYTAGEERLPCVTPDGGLLYYDGFNLCMRKANTPVPEWVVGAGWNSPAPPAVSPDDKTIIFERYLDPKKDEAAAVSLWCINADGTGLHELKKGMNPSISPDGKLIAFERLTSEKENAICLMNTDGTEERLIGFGRKPRFNPDNHWLVYSHWNYEYDDEWGLEQSLTTFSIEGENAKQSYAGNDRLVGGWSADGRWLLFTDGTNMTGIGKVNPLQTEKDTLTQNPNDHYAFFTPDGKQVLFLRPDHTLKSEDLYQLNLADGHESRLTMALAIEDFMLTPDGTQILFTAVPDSTRSIVKDFATGMTVDEAIRLGRYKFSSYYYDAVTKDWSTSGMCQASDVYIGLRSAKTASQMTRLSTEQQQLFKRTSDVLYEFTSSYSVTDEFENGGGSIYRVLNAGAASELEDTLAAIIVDLAHSDKKDATARAQTKKELDLLDAHIAAFSPRSGWDDADRQKEYEQSKVELKLAVQKLKKLVNDLPDAAALRVAAYASGLKSRFSFGPDE